MTKKLITAFVVFSIIALGFVVVWATLRTTQTRNAGIEDASVRHDRLEQSIVAAYLTDGSFAGGTVSQVVRRALSAYPDLLSVLIHDGTDTVYFASRSADYYDAEMTPDGAVSGIPEFRSHPLMNYLDHRTLILPDNSAYRLSLLSTSLSRTDLIPIIREILIALLSFMLLTALAIVMLPYLGRRDLSITPDDAHAYATQDDQSATPGTETQSTSSATPVEPPVAELPDREPATSIPSPSVVAHDPAAHATSDHDVTELEQVDSAPVISTGENDHAGLYSPKSGLGWEEYLEERLTTELKRAASFDQDLVLFLFERPSALKGSDAYHDFAESAREYFTFRDLCFEHGPIGIGVIVPNIDLDQGLERCEDFLQSATNEYGDRSLFCGLSARNGRLMSGKRLIREAEGALKRAKREPGGMVAFRVDPEKYRAYIASKS